MGWELNRTTFRRLVQLYLLTLPILIALTLIEAFDERWSSFDDGIAALSTDHFGPSRLETLPPWLPVGVLILLLGWMLASNIGLLWFARWARFGTWASVITIYVALLAVDGYRPSYTSPVYDWAAIIDGGLFGAIVLLAYAKGHGSLWFAPNADTGK